MVNSLVDEPARQLLQALAEGPLSGARCSSVAPHYLAGLRKVPAEVPTLVLAPGREFFVAPSAVGVWHLSRLSSSTARFSLWDLLNPAVLLV